MAYGYLVIQSEAYVVMAYIVMAYVFMAYGYLVIQFEA